VGVAAAAADIYERGGVLGFYRGGTPSIVRSFLVSGSRFTAFGGAMGVFARMRENTS